MAQRDNRTSPYSVLRDNILTAYADRRRATTARGLFFGRKARDDVAAGLLVVLQLQQATRLRRFQQFAEGAEAVVGLVETGLAALQSLLDHRAPHLFLLAAFLEQILDRFHHQVECFLLLLRVAARDPPRRLAGNCLGFARLRLFLLAHQVGGK